MTGFQLVKEGGEPQDWEDFFGYCADDAQLGSVRCVVLDGAAEGFDAQRWVRQLGEGFLALRGHLERTAVLEWIGQMQQCWLDDGGPSDLNLFEEIKLREQGSLATFLGCQINGLKQADPKWSAISLGDVVLFQVRTGEVIEKFPDLECGDFGINPIGVFTLPRMRARMANKLQERRNRRLEIGDMLYLASDAFAEWLIGCGLDAPWDFLADLSEAHVFEDFVIGLRAAGKIKNDDVTLLRVAITADDTQHLVVRL